MINRSTLVVLLMAFVTAVSGWAKMFDPLILPPCPEGCGLRVYGPVLAELFPWQYQGKTDVTEYFKSQGISFPQGGFAYFYQPTHTVIIATTPQNLHLVETLVEEETVAPK